MKLYILFMGTASVLGFVKSALVATILSAHDFGNYGMTLGAAMFLTMALSFGLIEATIKRFPRLWVERDRTAINAATRRIRMALFSRTAALLPLVVIGAIVLNPRPDLLAWGCVVVLGYAGILGRLESAQILAIGSNSLIARFSLLRSTFAITAATGGAVLFGWRGALIGELFAATATVIQARYSLRPHLSVGPAGPLSKDKLEEDRGLYASALLASAPTMLDRSAIAAASGAAIAGQYGFAMLLAQVGQVVVNIVCQKVGPSIIRSRKITGNGRAGSKMMLLACATVIGVSILTAGGVISAMALGIGADLISKYALSPTIVLIACASGAMSVFVIMEYAVIALDREQEVLRASGVAFLVFAIGLGVTALVRGPVEYYLLTGLLARAAQSIWLLVACRERLVA